jgi:hypothetical protein
VSVCRAPSGAASRLALRSARTKTKRLQHCRKATEIDTNRKMAIAATWSFLVVLGLPGLLLTSRNDPRNLPLAIAVLIGGTVVATVTTLFARKSVGGAGLKSR